MSAASDALKAADAANDKQRVAAVLQADSALKNLQAVQRVLSELSGHRLEPDEVAMLKRIAAAGQLYFEPQR